MNRTITLALVMVMAASNILWIESASAQAIPKPSVPEFTAKYIDRSYDTTATYSTNPFTGKNEVTQEANHIQDKTLELTIKNPAFTPYVDAENHSINLYYSIRVKGHFDGSWFSPDDGYYGPDIHYVGADLGSESTTFLYGIVGNNGTALRCFDIPEGGQVDFQVQAFVGYNTRFSDGMTVFGEVHHYVFTGESSEWSKTQTVTLTDNLVSNEKLQLNGEQMALAVAGGIIAVLAVALVMSWRKKA
jgi:hypothetical protein